MVRHIEDLIHIIFRYKIENFFEIAIISSNKHRKNFCVERILCTTNKL
ncbi:hypothetical protein KL86DYS1_11470 [uncultured Dysgonomonas sp.]|uniref:Uncharacterized protein n=1 Tax=uncultured Dysgonomonas sp. TaxID=206096 RepID=A0A212J8F6_9BACT|nr:hypothetical protein KL86DYS1_11470 [uncultured Dysgonomonas sp.]